jgi:hypothetical protein
VPSKDYSRWPPCSAGFFVKGERPRTHRAKKKIMKTNTNSDSRLQNRTAQRNQTQLHRIDFRQRFFNRGLPTDKVLDMLYHETPRFWELCQVVGKPRRWASRQFSSFSTPHLRRDSTNLSQRSMPTKASITSERMPGHTWIPKRARQWRFFSNATFALRSQRWQSMRTPSQKTFGFLGRRAKFASKEQMRTFVFQERVEIMLVG